MCAEKRQAVLKASDNSSASGQNYCLQCSMIVSKRQSSRAACLRILLLDILRMIASVITGWFSLLRKLISRVHDQRPISSAPLGISV
ncbi:hypothetical protein BV25DRAFT_831410 [Artomyces pyxidatus]|uniref:Uncharacterized protein n=1 Tax=Artomyces pyxidatus TaxID=48021 RepID=A0ACB8TGI2_9AGAM|nr:hypothetical protein BV25DRAFT_831410 [Artomyces pyxidatus]